MSIRDAITGPVATITVGKRDNIKVFYLHTKLLCEFSTYFKAAFSNGSEAAITQAISLDDEDPEVFGTYAAWIYDSELSRAIAEDTYTAWHDLEIHLVLLGIFSDKRGITKLLNDVLTMLSSYLHETGLVCPATIKTTLQLIPGNSKILGFLVAHFHHECIQSNANPADYPKEYIDEVLSRIIQTGTVAEESPFTHICQEYHTHNTMDEAEECQKLIGDNRNVFKE